MLSGPLARASAQIPDGVQTKGHSDKRPMDKRQTPVNKYEIFTLYYVPFSVIGADYTGPHLLYVAHT